MLKRLLLIMALVLFFVACDDDKDDDKNFKCTPACPSHKECTAENTCTLMKGKCDTVDDCTEDNKTFCNDKHECVEPQFTCTPACPEHKECTAENTCTLMAGKCDSNNDCTEDNKTECDKNTHECVEASSEEYPVKTIAEAKEADEKTKMQVQDITVTAVFKSKKGNIKAFTAQKDDQGIYVYINPAVNPKDFTEMAIGKKATVKGEKTLYNGVNQIKVKKEDITLSEGTELDPMPINLPLTEAHESALVKITGLFTITEMGSEANHKNTKLSIDGSGDFLIMRGDLYDFAAAGVEVGTNFTTITGVVSEWNENYSIVPRSAEELVIQND